MQNDQRASGTPQPPTAANASASQASDLGGVYQVVQEGLRAMQALQQQTAEAHQRFLAGQEMAHRTFQQVMESQQQLFERIAGLPVSAPVRTSVPQPAPVTPAPVAPVQQSVAQPTPVTVVPAPAPAPAVPQPAVQPEPAVANSQASKAPAGDFANVLLDVVAELTGYPVEMLDVSMDMEADLGIDSIKRVEILAAVQEKMPDLQQIESSHLGGLRMLQDIIDHMGGSSASPAPSTLTADATAALPSSTTAPSGDVAPELLAIVADLTGYPVEMLDVSMDMEADLGIDSIKRVEILAAVQEKLPHLNQVDSSHLGGLRTLEDIIAAIAPADASARASAAAAPVAEAQTVNPNSGSALPVSAPRAAMVDHDAIEPLKRQVLTTCSLDKGNPKPLAIAPGHEVWVIDDGTPLAEALVERFVAQGIAARVVGSTVPVDGEAVAPVGGLVHLFPPADRSDATTLDQLRSAFVLTRDLADDLRNAATRGGALLVTVSRMDGAFGLRGGDFDPVQGGLAGLAKTAAREWPDVLCRALDIDAGWNDPPAIADAMLAEFAMERPIEIGLRADGSTGLQLVSRHDTSGTTRLAENDLVIVTGGARGVTASCAMALAKSHKPTLALLGRSPLPDADPPWAASLDDPAQLKRAIMQNQFAGAKPAPSELEAAYRRIIAAREIRTTLQTLRAIGVQAVYRAVDVTDRSGVRAVVHELRDAFGPVHGIVHGAGVIEDRLIADKDDAQFNAVLDTKVVGLQALLDAIGSDDLKCLLLFSSVSGRFGREGQVDYAMANEVLNKVAHRESRRRPHCRVAALNWGAWDGGMVSGALKREFERLGVALIPLKSGAEAMVAELACGDRDAVEVVLGGSLPPLDPAPTDDVPKSIEKTQSDVTSDWDVAFERTLDVASHPFLKSHMIGGHCVLPLAVAMEWMGHAALHAHPGMHLAALNDLRVLKGVVLRDDAMALSLVTGAVERANGELIVPVELRSQTGDGGFVSHIRARATLAARPGDAPRFDAPQGLASQSYPHDANAIYRELLFHGEMFHALRTVEGHSEHGMIAEVSAAPGPDAWMAHPLRSTWLGDPLAVDAALQLGILWCVAHRDAPSLPSFVKGYRYYGVSAKSAATRCVLKVVESAANRLRADVWLVDDRGQVVAELNGAEWTVDAQLAKAFRAASRAAVGD